MLFTVKKNFGKHQDVNSFIVASAMYDISETFLFVFFFYRSSFLFVRHSRDNSHDI